MDSVIVAFGAVFYILSFNRWINLTVMTNIIFINVSMRRGLEQV
jgi:hypothetical protein